MDKKMHKILVIDDEINIAEGIRDSLEAEGYDIEISHDGENEVSDHIWS